MAFPTTSILDDFNRADEGPPPSASWGTFDVSWGFPAQLSVVSNAVQPSAFDTGANFWNAASYGPDCEVYCTLSNWPVIGVGDGDGLILYLRVLGESTDFITTASYYALLISVTPGSSVYQILRVSGLSVTILASGATPALATGDKLGLERSGNTLTAYHKPAAGAWASFDSILDGSPLSAVAGKLALNISPDNSQLIAIDDFGGGTISGPSAPVADFSGTPTSGPAPLTVDFTDASTNTPTSWAWDFGDGNTSTDQNPTNVYSTPGIYTVALTATNGAGDDTETKVDYITVLGAPVADFSGDTLTGSVPLTVNFTDLSTNSPDTWFWDFGDGGSSTSQNPTYIYAYTGVYTVTLTASSSAGSDSETKIDYITVTAVAETGPATIENCDIDTGGLAVGLRVSDVAYARDNRLGSVTIDVAAELRVKDNSYTTLTLNGTLTSLAGDRSVWDTANFPAAHAKDIDAATFTYHKNPALAATFTVSNPVTLRTIDLSSFTLNELGAIVGTLLADLGMA